MSLGQDMTPQQRLVGCMPDTMRHGLCSNSWPLRMPDSVIAAAAAAAHRPLLQDAQDVPYYTYLSAHVHSCMAASVSEMAIQCCYYTASFTCRCSSSRRWNYREHICSYIWYVISSCSSWVKLAVIFTRRVLAIHTPSTPVLWTSPSCGEPASLSGSAGCTGTS